MMATRGLWQYLVQLSWPQWRLQPWRSLVALLSVVLGVSLAFSVHLINASALSEFSSAVRRLNGLADFSLRGQLEGFDEAVYERVLSHPQVAEASPIIETTTLAQVGQSRVSLRVLGIDALVAPSLNPALTPQASASADPLAFLQPDSVFLNASARSLLRLKNTGTPNKTIEVQQGLQRISLKVSGDIALTGTPTVVMDLAGVQTHLGWLGKLSQIDIRLQPGANAQQVVRDLDLPPGIDTVTVKDSQQQASNVSRAYRVNLTVLALVALFTASFLVFSVLSLSVTRRMGQFALLGVLGMSERERMILILLEALILGAVGSLMGVLAGTGLAAAALTFLSGDLGSGHFAGIAPPLQFSVGPALVFAGLGVSAALLGAWIPARMAQRIQPAQALKGLGLDQLPPGHHWIGPALGAAGIVLALLPPIQGIPIAAYLSVACLLLGGIASVPAGIDLLLRMIDRRGATKWLESHPVPLLAVMRAKHYRHSATVAVAGCVSALALSVALTIMVASFRHAVTDWLDTLLPADLYVRTHLGALNDSAFIPTELPQLLSSLPEVERTESQRTVRLQLNPEHPPITLLARPLNDPDKSLPLISRALPGLPGEINGFVSEAVAALYGVEVGKTFEIPLPPGRSTAVQIRGIWRDYAHPHGSLVLSHADYRRLSGDDRITDVSVWLKPGQASDEVRQRIRDYVAREIPGSDGLLEISSPGEIREISLRIFDRSFAVTYWLQGVAIGIGLFGIAASFSAQVLARRKEFGLLTHLGLTRGQVLMLVTGEGLIWTAAGTLVGAILGAAVSVVLVEVVNPQSFHWTMDLVLPWLRLAALCSAVIAAGGITAWLSARSTSALEAARAVKEDW